VSSTIDAEHGTATPRASLVRTIEPMTGDAFDALVAAMDGAMVVVTAAAGEERDGCLVGFHSQASIDPPRFAVWLSIANRTWRLSERADVLAVHLLGEDQRALAERFGGQTGDEVDKLARTAYEAGPGGVPLLAECPNRFVGRIVERLHDRGDHVCVVLAPIDAAADDPPRPLRSSQVTDIEPGHPA
jgi:flavin reductase (DIM6/NTAB) family NADH-FMN oxidoreductase RutF